MGRPAVVPPAGREVGWMRALPGRWGEGGALSPKAPRARAAGSEIQPYLGDAGRGGDGPRGLVPYREVGGPDGPRRRVAAVGRDGVSLSIPRADGLGKKWTERTRSVPGGQLACGVGYLVGNGLLSARCPHRVVSTPKAPV